MKTKTIIKKTNSFRQDEKKKFLELLKEQNQVKNPTLVKINKCHFLCIAYDNDTPIGIGALKNVYKSPFDYAKLNPELKKLFNYELGYLYIKNNEKYRGLGIGKSISKLLVNAIPNENIFATTELSENNAMLHILKGLGFSIFGSPFIGKNTGKTICLMLKFRNNEKEKRETNETVL